MAIIFQLFVVILVLARCGAAYLTAEEFLPGSNFENLTAEFPITEAGHKTCTPARLLCSPTNSERDCCGAPCIPFVGLTISTTTIRRVQRALGFQDGGSGLGIRRVFVCSSPNGKKRKKTRKVFRKTTTQFLNSEEFEALNPEVGNGQTFPPDEPAETPPAAVNPQVGNEAPSSAGQPEFD